MEDDGLLEPGGTTLLSSYKFGRDSAEAHVPLTRDDMQWVVVEVGWKSDNDGTP